MLIFVMGTLADAVDPEGAFAGLVSPLSQPRPAVAKLALASTEPFDVVTRGGADAVSLLLPENTTFVTGVEVAGGTGSEGIGVSVAVPGVDAGLFDLDTTTGVLSFLTPPDFENLTPSQDDGIILASSIPATDAAGAQASQAVSIEVASLSSSLLVDTALDVVDANDGLTSLREALAFANAQAGADTIIFAAGLVGTIRLTQGELVITDDVTIDGDGQVTITGDSNGDDVVKTNKLTDVAGSGASLLDDNSRVLLITSAAGAVTLDGLTITGGRTEGNGLGAAGAGVLAQNSVLNIVNSTIAGNSTAGSGAGGAGVFSTGTLTLANSTISDNAALGYTSDGGGIFAAGDATLLNATISGNSTAGNFGFGGGVYGGGDLTLIHSTVSGNSTAGTGSSGAGVAGFGQVTLVNSIVLGNVARSGTNEVYEADDLFGSGNGVVEFLGLNIVGAGTDTNGADGVINADPSDVFERIEQNAADANVYAGVLSNNGGPVATIALSDEPLNPALDAASAALPTEADLGVDVDGDGVIENTAISVDARGLARDVDLPGDGGTPDLGAFELQSLPPDTTGSQTFTVTTLADELSAGTDSTLQQLSAGDGLSLREAIALVNQKNDSSTPAVDVIEFADGLTGTIRLTQGQLEIVESVTIEGGGLITITGDADNDDILDPEGLTDVMASGEALLDDNSRIFDVTDANLFATFNGLTLTGGHTTGDDEGGGAIRSIAAVILNETKVIGNSTSGYLTFGGAISVDHFLDPLSGFLGLVVYDSTISGNATFGARSGGGAVYMGGSLRMNGSTVSDNATLGFNANGGAIFAVNSVRPEKGSYIVNSTINGNYTVGNSAAGGAIFNIAPNSPLGYSDMAITNSTISGNHTLGSGAVGGAIVSFTDLRVENSTVSGNYTAGEGALAGGLSKRNGASTFTLSNSVVLGNVSAQSNDDELEVNSNNPFVEFLGTNIVGANPSAFDASISPNLINADTDAVFAETFDNGGVRAGVLDDKGGPVETIGLKADLSNPALDAGDDSLAPATDARGELRLVNVDAIANNGANTVDLGAFETQTTATIGPDILPGTDGDDEVAALDGNDLLLGGLGNDTLEGGEGEDTADYSESDDFVFVALGAFAANGDAEGDTLTDIEHLRGSAFADFLQGDGVANNLSGGDGGDFIVGLVGNDTLEGGEGNDALEGGLGDDTIDGGGGDDFYAALGASLPVTLDLADMSNSSAGFSGDVLIDIEGVLGATNQANIITGNADDLQLIGGAVDDVVTGGTGAEFLVGLAGNDALSGNGGADLFFGDTGNDTMTGGAGGDTFFFIDDGVDMITDFDVPASGAGAIDRVFFSGAGLSFGDLSFSEVSGGAVISYGSGSSATFEGVDLATLLPDPANAPDWLFVFT